MNIHEREARLAAQLAAIKEAAQKVIEAADRGVIVAVWLCFDALEREVIDSGKPRSREE